MSKECLNRLEVYTKMTDLSIPNPPKSEFELAAKQECGQVFGADTDYLGITSIIKPGESVYECLPSERIVKPGSDYRPYPQSSTAIQSIFQKHFIDNPDAPSIIRFGYGLTPIDNKAHVFYDVELKEIGNFMGIGFPSTTKGRLRCQLGTVDDPIFNSITFNFEYDRSSFVFNIVGMSYSLVNGTPATTYTYFLNEVTNKLKTNWFNLWTGVFLNSASKPDFIFEIQYPIF